MSGSVFGCQRRPFGQRLGERCAGVVGRILGGGEAHEVGVALGAEPMQRLRGARPASRASGGSGSRSAPSSLSASRLESRQRAAPLRRPQRSRLAAQQRGEAQQRVRLRRQRQQPRQALQRRRPGTTCASTPVSAIRRERRQRIAAPRAACSISAWMRSPERLRDLGRGRGAGRERLGVGRRPAVVREEAEEAQDAQIVLGDPLRRRPDEADPAGGEVGAAAEIVEQAARRDRSSSR